MKKFFVGLLYIVIVVAVLVVVAAVGATLYHVIWLPLLGVGFADPLNVVSMVIAGGLVGHFASKHMDDFMDWLGA
jgi:energy-converting hydrogenase Eha subunit G